MIRQFITSLIFLSIILLFPGCGGSSGGGVGAEGGIVVSNDGRVVLSIPAGALTGSTEVRVVERVGIETDTSFIDAGGAFVYELEPSGLTFAEPVTFSIELDEPPVAGETDLVVMFNVSGETVELLGAQTLTSDGSTVTVSGTLAHFSTVWGFDGPFKFGLIDLPNQIIPLGGSYESVRASVRRGSLSAVSVEKTTVLYKPAPLVDALFSATPDVVLLGSFPAETGSLTLFVDSIITCGTIAGTSNLETTIRLSNYEFDDRSIGIAINSDGSGRAVPQRVVDYSFFNVHPILCGGTEEQETDLQAAESSPGAESEESEPISFEVTTGTLLSFRHSVGTDPCPQEVGTITLSNNGSQVLEYSITTEGALATTPSSITSATGETVSITVLFLCDQNFDAGNVLIEARALLPDGSIGDEVVRSSVRVLGTILN